MEINFNKSYNEKSWGIIDFIKNNCLKLIFYILLFVLYAKILFYLGIVEDIDYMKWLNKFAIYIHIFDDLKLHPEEYRDKDIDIFTKLKKKTEEKYYNEFIKYP